MPEHISPSTTHQKPFDTLCWEPWCSETSLWSVIYFKALFIPPASARTLTSRKSAFGTPRQQYVFWPRNFLSQNVHEFCKRFTFIVPSATIYFSCFQKAAIPFHSSFCTSFNEAPSQHTHRDRACSIQCGYLNISNPITWIYSNTFSCQMF